MFHGLEDATKHIVKYIALHPLAAIRAEAEIILNPFAAVLAIHNFFNIKNRL
jgi:hypothetical protein